jgi:hypothetical protein
MSIRTNFGQLAQKLDYSALEQKLTQLAEREPPKDRKTAADVLEPLREKLLALHRKGWSGSRLVEELRAAGVPVSPARFRECLSRWTNNGRRTTRPRGNRPINGQSNDSQPATPASQVTRSKTASAATQSGFRLKDS